MFAFRVDVGRFADIVYGYYSHIIINRILLLYYQRTKSRDPNRVGRSKDIRVEYIFVRGGPPAL